MQRSSEGDCVGRQEQVENVGPSVQDEKSGAHAFAHRFSPSTLMKFPLLISMLLQERNAAESDGDREWHVSFSRKYRHVLLKKHTCTHCACGSVGIADATAAGFVHTRTAVGGCADTRAIVRLI